LLSVFSSLPVSGQRGRVSIEGDGLGVALGSGLGVGGGVEGTLSRANGFEQAASPAPTSPNMTARRLICAT
jgi:hypothetical protein